MFRNALMKMANAFTNIQCITALTLVFINNACTFHFQVYIPYKFEIKLTNYFLRPIHIFKFVVFFDLCKDFRLFSALMHCPLVKPFLNTWVFRPLLVNLSKPPFSNIHDHHQASGHPISPGDFSIVSTCSSSSELLLRESLLTSELKPALYANLTSVPLTLYN